MPAVTIYIVTIPSQIVKETVQGKKKVRNNVNTDEVPHIMVYLSAGRLDLLHT